ncbi:MAG: outer membrane protein assembly factor BamD [Chitinophagaceae bacterium]
MRNLKITLLAITVAFSFISCTSKFEKIQKSKDFDYKLSQANLYYDKKQFGKANVLYEELLTVYKGTKSFEGLYYKYCYTFMYDKNYLPASYHFKHFVELFPKSPNAEECEYLHSLCLYYLSPDYTLDQSNTVKSIASMQQFVNENPTSKRVKDANNIIDNSRAKLEEKDAYAANLYYKISEYKAAAVAFEQILRKYPDSKNADYYAFMAIKSTYKYAILSVNEKQEERFSKTVADCKDFFEKYAKSKYKSEIERINTLSLQALKKVAKK